MFESQTLGFARLGADEPHLNGAQVVIGVADDFGNVLGWFGRDYHPNEQLVDAVGADDEDYVPEGIQLVMGLADLEEENIIGFSLGKFLKKVGKAVTAPITAPISAVKAIAMGKPVFPALVKSVVKPVTSQFKLAATLTKPVTTLASKPVGLVFGKKVGKAVAYAGTAPFTIPGKTLTLLSKGKVGAAAKTAFVDPTKRALTIASGVTRPFVATASAIVRPVVGKKIARGLTNVSMTPFTTVRKTTEALERGKPLEALKQSVVQPLSATAGLAKPVLKAASPILKSKITAAVVSGVALAFPPLGVPLAAGYAAARVALPYASTALGVADKVLSAAKGTLPSMKQAPPMVAAALQKAAKATIDRTYQAATLGSQDAQRALGVLVTAREVQAAMPAAQAAIHPYASIPNYAVQDAPLVEKTGNVIDGQWQKVPENGTHEGPIVLQNGVIIRGSWNQVA